MEGSLRVLAPAKINLHLEVGPDRGDGYHRILSLFHAVSLHDAITIRSLKESSDCRVRGLEGLVPEGRSSVHRAVEAFRRESGIDRSLEIEVNKAIPAGAGLGGASADAAACLRGLNRLFGTGFSLPTLERMAASVGSDVPFLLRGGAALVGGRGELIEAIAPREDFSLVIIYPGIESPTAAAYAAIDAEASFDGADWDSRKLLEDAFRRDPGDWPFRNRFEAPVSRIIPKVGEALAKLRDSGARFAAMSGSGSACFGVFDSIEAADAAAHGLKRSYTLVSRCSPLARLPEPVLE
jgi:4-diphosphocytidyl-2-C-methyl-D-erythritol kinase